MLGVSDDSRVVAAHHFLPLPESLVEQFARHPARNHRTEIAPHTPLSTDDPPALSTVHLLRVEHTREENA